MSCSKSLRRNLYPGLVPECGFSCSQLPPWFLEACGLWSLGWWQKRWLLWGHLAHPWDELPDPSGGRAGVLGSSYPSPVSFLSAMGPIALALFPPAPSSFHWAYSFFISVQTPTSLNSSLLSTYSLCPSAPVSPLTPHPHLPTWLSTCWAAHPVALSLSLPCVCQLWRSGTICPCGPTASYSGVFISYLLVTTVNINETALRIRHSVKHTTYIASSEIQGRFSYSFFSNKETKAPEAR